MSFNTNSAAKTIPCGVFFLPNNHDILTADVRKPSRLCALLEVQAEGSGTVCDVQATDLCIWKVDESCDTLRRSVAEK